MVLLCCDDLLSVAEIQFLFSALHIIIVIVFFSGCVFQGRNSVGDTEDKVAIRPLYTDKSSANKCVFVVYKTVKRGIFVFTKLVCYRPLFRKCYKNCFMALFQDKLGLVSTRTLLF